MSALPEKIMLATDGSEDAVLAARAAVDLSARTGSELHIVHVLEPMPRYAYPGVTPEVYEHVRAIQEREASELLKEQEKRVGLDGARRTRTHLKRGPAVDEILDLAEKIGAGLIVLGSRGHGPVERLVMGSVSEGVVSHASCPVLVLRGGEEAWPPVKIVIGDDGLEAAGAAGTLAVGIGALFGTTGLLVRAYPRLPEADIEGRELDARMVDDELRREERKLQRRAVELEEASGVRPKVRLAVGDPAACILGAAQDGGAHKTLIAVGSRGLGTMQRLRFGSVSTKVLRAAEGPVLIHPPVVYGNREGQV
jgi:nucleotide-binding universal stress UspA family protein